MSHNISKDRNIQILLSIVKHDGMCHHIGCAECIAAFDEDECPGQYMSTTVKYKYRVELAQRKLKEYSLIQITEDEPQIILNQEY
jgi:hypothetical protein